MRRMRMALLAPVAALALAGPAAAGAPPPAGDSVRGTQDGPSWAFDIDASSGPAGENPTGTVQIGPAPSFPLTVTCLSVTGNTAIIGFTGAEQFMSIRFPVAGLIKVVDGGGPGSGLDSFDWAYDTGPPDRVATLPGPTTCSGFPGPFPPAFFEIPVTGDIAVTDGQALPSSKKECKHGGWRDFGFKSKHACKRFVRLH